MKRKNIRARLSFASVAACALCYPGSSFGSADNWTNSVTGADSWGNTLNWSANALPQWQTFDPAVIDNGQASIDTLFFNSTNNSAYPGTVLVGDLSTGLLTVNGGSLGTRSFLAVGEANGSMGTLNQSGGAVGGSNITIGDLAGSNGTYLLSGTSASTLTTGTGNNLIVGNFGTGLMSVQGTPSVSPSFIYVGDGNGSNGTMQISGGSFSIRNAVTVGEANGSTGIINQSGGSFTAGLSNFNIVIGDQAGSFGSYFISGGSLAMGTSGTLTIGNSGTGLFILEGGPIVSPAFVFVGDSNKGNGTFIVGASIAIRSSLIVGEASGSTGTVHQSAGTVNGSLGSLPLIVGDMAGSNGYYYLSGGAVNTGGQNLVVGNSGTGLFNISGSATGTTPTLYIGNNSSGTLQVTGGTVTTSSLMLVGEANQSVGTVVQTGGAVNAGSVTALVLGDKNGSSGSYYLSGGQIKFTTNNGGPIIGNMGTGLLDVESTATGSSAPLLQSGTASNLIVGNTSTGVGTLQGYFTSTGSGTLTNNGKIIADGHGSPNTMDLSSFEASGNPPAQKIQQTIANPGAGWFAQNMGLLKLGTIGVTNPNGSYEWGENTPLTSTSLVNSVQANFTTTNFFGVDAPLNISLLAPNRSEVTSGNTLPASTSFIGVWDISTNNINNGAGQTPLVNFEFRYDDVAAGAVTPSLYELIGTTWTAQSDTVANDLLTTGMYNPASFSSGTLFAIGITTGPASGSSTWNTSSGTWETASNWTNNTIPNVAGQVATFADSIGTNPATVTLTANETVGTVAFTGTLGGSYTIAATGSNALTLNNNASTGSITVNAGSQIINAPVSLTNGVNINTASGSSVTFGGSVSGTGPFTVTTGSNVIIAANGSIGVPMVVSGTTIFSQASGGSSILVRAVPSLNISSGTVSLAAAASSSTRQLLTVGGLSLSGATNAWTGKMDLANNDLIVRNGSLGTITNQVGQGFNGGTWQGGGGITSSIAAADTSHLTALGVIQNSTDQSPSGSVLHSTFDTAASAASDVLVKYTYYGDANLDGKVDGSDYSLIDAGYLANGAMTGWYNGDFNYDGVINGSDYTLIDNTFNAQGASLADSVASPSAVVTAQIAGGNSAVPEPATIGLLGISAFAMLGRRRRRFE